MFRKLTRRQPRCASSQPFRPGVDALTDRITPAAVTPLSGQLLLDGYDDGAGMGSVFLSDTDLAVNPSGQFATSTLYNTVKASISYANIATSYDKFGAQNARNPASEAAPSISQPASIAIDAAGNTALAYVAPNSTTPANNSVFIDYRTFAAGTPNLGVEIAALTDDPDISLRGTAGFAVVAEAADADGSGIFAQLLSATGGLSGAAFPINTTTTGAQIDPVVAADSAGNFVVAWVSADSDGTGIFARRFEADGDPLGGEFQVNDVATGAQSQPTISVAADGSFLIGWTDGASAGIRIRSYDDAGNPTAASINVTSTLTGQHSYPSVALSATGSYVVAWQSTGGTTISGILARFVDPGQTQYPVVQISLPRTSFSDSTPRVAFSDESHFLISWNRSQTTGGELRQVLARRFEFNPTPANIAGFGSGGVGWWAGDSNGTALVNRFLGQFSAGINWQNLGAADVNGDGLADVIGRDPSTGVWWVGINTNPGISLRNFGTWSTALTYSNLQFADINGDTRMDVVGRDNGGSWWAGISDGTKFVTQRIATWASSINWQDVFVGDVNGDGGVDLVGRDPSTGNWWASVRPANYNFANLSLTNTLWGKWSTAITWLDVRAGDLNNDLRLDVVGRAASSGQLWTGLSIGTGNAFFNQLWGTFSSSITWSTIVLADVNGDGRADLVGRDAANANLWVGLNATGTNFVNQLWGTLPTGGGALVDYRVIDFDGDGLDDLLARELSTGNWRLARSTGTSFVVSNVGNWTPNASWSGVTAGTYRR
jgi:hypothetical protein